MNGKALSEALGNLPEDMVAEAMEPAAKRRIPWLRIVACFAVVISLFFGMPSIDEEIVTAPGILTVEVYAVDENSEEGYISVPLKTGVYPGDTSWGAANSFRPGLPVHLVFNSCEFPIETIRFIVSVEAGTYIDWDNNPECKELPSQFELLNDSWIYWRPIFDISFLNEEYDQVYSTIVICCEDHIIGYAVLRFDCVEDAGLTYSAALVSSVYFPKQHGVYQRVTYEYVRECIEESVQ